MALKVTSGVSKATAGLDVFESQVADMVEEVLGAYQDASEWDINKHPVWNIVEVDSEDEYTKAVTVIRTLMRDAGLSATIRTIEEGASFQWTIKGVFRPRPRVK